MNPWLRRLIYLLLLLLWLLVMAFPIVAFTLATQEEIRLGGAPGRELRLFMVTAEDAEGVGVEWSRARPGRCRETALVYLLWQGTGENVTYCRCFDDAGATVSSTAGACPP